MKQKGFTFIEILVVITLIAILVMIGAVSYGSINKRSRDARRKSDIEQIRSALEMYRADTGFYPDEGPATFGKISSDADLKTALLSYLSKIPTDPLDDTVYPYQIIMSDSRGSPAHYYGYCLAASLESGSDRSTRPGESASTGLNACTSALPSTYDYGMKNP
jgi:general secretion pathway protein G